MNKLDYSPIKYYSVMKRTVFNLIAGAVLMSGIMTAVSAQAQDRRGGGNSGGSGRSTQMQQRGGSSSMSTNRTPQVQQRSYSSPSVSNNSRSSSSMSTGSNRRPNMSSSAATQQRQTVTPRTDRQVTRDNSVNLNSRSNATQQRNYNSSTSTNRRPDLNSGASHWPGSSSNNSSTATRPSRGASGNAGDINSGNRPGNNRGNNNGNNSYYNNGGNNNRNYNGNSYGNNYNNNYRGNNNGNYSGGRRPGGDARTGYGPSNGGIDHNPRGHRTNYDHYRYSTDNRVPMNHRHNDRFYDSYRHNSWSWYAPVRPPHRPYRPASLWYYRPVVPAGYTYYYSAPVVSGVIGLEFGTPFSSSLNFLYYNGYVIDGYYDNIVYLRDVPMLDYVWPDVMLQYDARGLAYAQFIVSSPYDDRYRFNRIYNDLCISYGTPIRRSGYNGYFSWYGGGGVGYINLGLTYDAGRYYTTISFGY